MISNKLCILILILLIIKFNKNRNENFVYTDYTHTDESESYLYTWDSDTYDMNLNRDESRDEYIYNHLIEHSKKYCNEDCLAPYILDKNEKEVNGVNFHYCPTTNEYGQPYSIIQNIYKDYKSKGGYPKNMGMNLIKCNINPYYVDRY